MTTTHHHNDHAALVKLAFDLTEIAQRPLTSDTVLSGLRSASEIQRRLAAEIQVEEKGTTI